MGRKIYQYSLIRAHAKKILNKRVSQYSREQFTDEENFIKARRIGAVDRRVSVAAGFSDGVRSIKKLLMVVTKHVNSRNVQSENSQTRITQYR